METNEKSVFDVIMGYSVNEGLDGALRRSREHMEIQKRIDEQAEEVDRQDFTKEQRQMIDRLICAHTESGASYGRMTYKQGFRDCISLLREMGLLKAS